MSTSAVEIIERVARRTLKPRLLETPWQWAERHVRLSVRNTSTPGKYDSSWICYTRKWQEVFSDSSTREIVICSGAQTGKTEAILNCLRYAIAEDPGPMLWIMPAESLARSFSETRLQPSLRDCPPCREQMPSDPDLFKLTEMHFKECSLTLVGAGSAAQLSSRPIRFLFGDEIDKWPEAGKKEAGALDLARVRTTSFWNSKIILASTPTLESGAIWVEFLKGSQCRFFVPCPHCSLRQCLVFQQLKWPLNETTKPDGKWNVEEVSQATYYECEGCRGRIAEQQKAGLIRAGEWRQTNPSAPKERASFHLSALYSPWRTWGSIAAEFLESKDSYSAMQNFTNSVLAEPWKVHAETIDESGLASLRGEYALGTLPIKPLFLTLTADVQRAELYFTVRAWGTGGESWLVDYGRVPSFSDLQEVLLRRYPISGDLGEMGIWRGIIDSGFNTKSVYEFTLETSRMMLPCKGWDRLAQPVRWAHVNFQGNRQRRISLLHFDATSFKNDLFLRRIKDRNGPPWHIPRDVGNDYIQQLTAERLSERKNQRGAVELVWTQVRRDNHYGDCEVMQLACSHVLGAEIRGASSEPHTL